jgi:hypothetical protein
MECRILNIDGLSREQVRQKILLTWLEEDPGTGQYRYDVESCSDGSKIYLLRPARLNKGCDFVIISENFLRFKNGKDKPPSHGDVLQLIASFARGNKEVIQAFHDAAQKVYNCHMTDETMKQFSVLEAVEGCRVERSLKLLKWMWIEQDITYWTGEGRAKLWNCLCNFITKMG